jgi:hypothetical protein
VNITARNLERGRRILDEFVRSEYFQCWTSDSDRFLAPSRQDRARRCYEAAEHGADGSTHAEVIQDEREAWHAYARRRYRWEHVWRVDAAVSAAIDAVEEWHAANGSLDQEVG